MPKTQRNNASELFAPEQLPAETPRQDLSANASSEPEIIELGPAIYNRYVGTYQLLPNMQITIRVEEAQLLAQATGQEAFNLYPVSETKFVARIADITIQFDVSAEETVGSLTLFQAGQALFAPKLN